MLIWVLYTAFVAVSGKVLPVFESEIIKKIFEQDASFCFRPFESKGCNETLWERYPVARNITAPEPKTLAFLFTPKSTKNPEYLHKCGGQLPQNSNYNPRLRTEIIIHGFLDGACRSAWMREIKDQLFKRGNYNVILIDWTWGNGPNYTASTNNTKIVGEQLSFILQNIMNQTGAGPENFHLVGHSLGAHIAGFAGKRVKHLRRITALDPALTPFHNMSKYDRLDSSDADLVDVIHTNAGTQPGEALGDINPLGHADFYPNGGSVQEGCRRNIVKSYLTLDFLYATISLVPRICSHMHAVQYYKASINPKRCEFIGVQCPDYESFLSGECTTCHQDGLNCAVMGMNYEYLHAPINQTGSFQLPRKFYLNTTIDYPYCDNSGLSVEESEVFSSTL